MDSREHSHPLRGWLTPATLIALAIGTLWRWLHITRFHDPRRYVYSDMADYLVVAKRMVQPGHVPAVTDVTHPPGATAIFAFFYRLDPSLQSLVWFQFAVAAAVPLAVGALAWVVFDRSTARLAVILSSLYFPFVDYGGFFLSEVYMMLAVPVSLAIYLRACQLRSTAGVVVLALVAGVALSGALALKLLALPAILGCAAVHWLFFRGATRRVKAIALGALLLGTLPGTFLLSWRCTVANQGRFCLVSNNSAAEFLLGHYGRIQGITWRDPQGPPVFHYANPSAYQRYRHQVELPFAYTDAQSNLRAATGWIREHPIEAVVLSAEHVYDLFIGSFPWPAFETEYWVGAEEAHFLFIVFLFFPALCLCVDSIRRHGVPAFLGGEVMLILSPILGLVAATVIATGEPRYRIPFDGLLIIAAIRFYLTVAPRAP
jgi:hypothetical protein